MTKQCCPKCGGTSGYTFYEVAHIGMYSIGWGLHDLPEASGQYRGSHSPSLFECSDCGAKFQEKTVLKIRGVL